MHANVPPSIHTIHQIYYEKDWYNEFKISNASEVDRRMVLANAKDVQQIKKRNRRHKENTTAY
jgi:hypothetical protein